MTKFAGMTLIEKLDNDYNNLKKSLEHIVCHNILSDIEFAKLNHGDIIKIIAYYKIFNCSNSDINTIVDTFIERYLKNNNVISCEKELLLQVYER